MTERLCTACNNRFSKEEFYKNQWKKKSGRRCKPCHNEFYGITAMQHAGAEAKKQKSNAQKKERKQRKRVKERDEAEARANAEEAVRLARKRGRKHKEANEEPPEKPRRAYDEDFHPRPPPSKNWNYWSIDQNREYSMARFERNHLLRMRGVSEEEWRRDSPAEPPSHPDGDFFNSCIVAQRKFEVLSGALCFGRPNNCRSGAAQEPASFQNGNISASFNYRANNGTWLVYRLNNQDQPAFPSNFNRRTGKCVQQAWFVCLNTLCPVEEVRLLLYHDYPEVKSDNKRYAWKCVEFDQWEVGETDRDQPADGFYVMDSKDAKDEMWAQGSGAMRTDDMAVKQRQRCLIGFNKRGVKAMLFCDTRCDFEKQYFENGQFSINHMPWTPDHFVCRDWEPNSMFFETESANKFGAIQTKYYRKIFDLRGQMFAVVDAHNDGVDEVDEIDEGHDVSYALSSSSSKVASEQRSQKRLTDFFRNVSEEQRKLEEIGRMAEEKRSRKEARNRASEQRALADDLAREERKMQQRALAAPTVSVEMADVSRKRTRSLDLTNGSHNFARAKIEGNLENNDEVRWRKGNKKPPRHPDSRLSCTDMKPYHRFAVSSGAIHFGQSRILEDDSFGALACSEPAASYNDIGPSFVVSDSTAQSNMEVSQKCQQTNFTYRAYNGNWCVYKLEKKVAPEVFPELNSRTGELVRNAWFICHSDIRPVEEARLLLYHGYFGDEIIKVDGMKDIKYPKPIEYQRIDFSGGKRKLKDSGSEKYSANDVGGCEGSGYMLMDGGPGNQTCILGFARSDAIKSLFLVDNDCDPEELYFNGAKLPLFQMPWTRKTAVDADENDSNFFVLTRREAPGIYDTSKHRYLTNVHGELFATIPVGEERDNKRTKRTFFNPRSRPRTVATLPPDVMNPHVLKFLTMEECLPLMGSCKYLHKVLDPYRFACLLNTFKNRYVQRSNPRRLRFDRDYQDRFLVRKASTSDEIVHSLFKNKVMTLWKGGEISYFGSSNDLVRQIIKGLIRNNRLASLKHIRSLGRLTIDDFLFAVRQNKADAIELLRRSLLDSVRSAKKCSRCNGDVAAFFCRRIEFEGNTTHKKDEKYGGLCRKCCSSEQYCQLCDEYECDECYETNWRGGALSYGVTDIKYGKCSTCRRNVCCELRSGSAPKSCSLECSRCGIVTCWECNGSQWKHCSKCYNEDRGDIRALCSGCSVHGCTEERHGAKHLLDHKIEDAVVIFSDYESYEEASDKQDEEEEYNYQQYGGCQSCGDDCFDGLGFRNPWCMGRYF